MILGLNQEFLNKTELMGLPELDIAIDKDELPTGSLDSRGVLVKGSFINPTNGTGFWKFDKWIEPKLIDPSIGNGVRLGADKVNIDNADEKGAYWFAPKVPGNYLARLRGHSRLGRFARQIIEADLSAEDLDADKMSDYWEARFNLDDPSDDPDKDCLTNLEEFEQGKYPNKADSGDSSCNDATVLQAPVLDDGFTLTNGVATVKWNAVDNAEKYMVYVSDKPSVSSTQYINKFTTNTTTQNISGVVNDKALYVVVVTQNTTLDLTSDLSNEIKIEIFAENITINLPQNTFVDEGEDKNLALTLTDPSNRSTSITCLSENGIAQINKVGSEYRFIAPNVPNGVDSFKFKIECTAFYDADNKIISDETLVTVAKQAVENQSPTVKLSSDQTFTDGKKHSFTLKPVSVTDEDTGTLTYAWSVNWTGTQGSTGSVTSSDSFGVETPLLQVGESGSGLFTLTVTDSEGKTASDSVKYSYNLAKVEALEFVSDNFTDGSTLNRGSSNTLTWTVKNAGNVDLTDVQLKLSSEVADKLGTPAISPTSIADWPVGVSKTFTTTVDVPKTVDEGTHKQVWNFYYGSNQPLPYVGKSAAAPLFFIFKTTKPNDFVGRFILDKKVVKPGQTVTGLLEVNSGNDPYKVTVDWGDGTAPVVYTDVPKNTATGMTQSSSHSYASEGTYNISVKVVDNADKQATYTDVIKVSSLNAPSTDWQVDIHDIVTNELVVNYPFTVTSKTASGKAYEEYSTDWEPNIDPTSKEYFVKYRLPVPAGLLKLDKKMRFTVRSKASIIPAYDREINIRTSNQKEYTASVRSTGFQDTLPDGTPITGGYFTTKDLNSGVIVKQAAALLSDTNGENNENSVYILETNPDTSLLSIYPSTGFALFEKNIALGSNWITELDVTFKGNGKLELALLEYDLNGDGEFTANEKLVLNTHDKSVDWSQFGVVGELKPDLIVTSLVIQSFTQNSIDFEYTIKNIGTGVAHLDGPTDSEPDNVSIQTFLSADTIFNNNGDIAAGGTILGLSPLGDLAPGETYTGSFSPQLAFDITTTPYITFKVDWGESVDELDETNNTFSQVISSQIKKVSGEILVDTVWEKQDSPIFIKDDVSVVEGVTLMIEPGTIIIGNNHNIIVFGTLNAIGDENSHIIIDHGSIIHGNNDGFKIVIDYAEMTGGRVYYGSVGGHGHGSISLKNSVLKDIPYMYLWYPDADSYIEKNIFINSGGISVGNGDVNVYIKNNVFYQSTGTESGQDFAIENWASYGASETIVKYNSFLSTDRIAVLLPIGYDSAKLSATENYWNTSDTAVIESMIFDKNDDLGVNGGFIDYAPFLTAPHPDTPDYASYISHLVPIAHSGDDQISHIGSSVFLEAGATLYGGADNLSYRWFFKSLPETSQVSLNEPSSKTPYFVPDVMGKYTLSLIINDGVLDSTTDNIEIDVVPVNSTPITTQIMFTDTTLSKVNSPYYLTDNIQIAEGVTLTIESGTTIIGNNHNIIVFGTLNAIGDENSHIIIDHGSIIHGNIDGFKIVIDYAEMTGGRVYYGSVGGHGHGSISLKNSVLKDIPYMYLWYPDADSYIEKNIFINSGGISVGNGDVNVYIRNNVFYQSTGTESGQDFAIENWASYGASETIVKYNSFLSSQP